MFETLMHRPVMAVRLVMLMVREHCFLLVWLCGLAALALMTGCSWMRENPESARIMVQYETLRVLDGDVDRAQRLVTMVQRGRQFVLQGDQVAVSYLADAARAAINWDSLPPQDQLLVDEALTAAQRRLEERLGGGWLRPEQRLELDEFLGWIEAAAQRLLAPAVMPTPLPAYRLAPDQLIT